MTAIVTSLLGGGWGLVAGWILPTALNSLLFGLLVLPVLGHVAGLAPVAGVGGPAKALILLAAAVIVGLVLSAVQTPLYRVLEGYQGMPSRLRRRRISHHTARKNLLAKRRDYALLIRRERLGAPRETDAARLAELRQDPSFSQISKINEPVSQVTVSMLAEQIRRYPVHDEQVMPTLLGNVIRQFEEYGYDRYRLDGVTMWNALVSVAPDEVRKRVDAGRASVDFFVCLIYGHVVLAACGVAALAAVPHHPVGPVLAIVVPAVLIPLWYGLAVGATAEWAAAFRSLIDIGRKPLAEALGLAIPATIEQERRMWELASRFSRRPYMGGDPELDQFRAFGHLDARPVILTRGGLATGREERRPGSRAGQPRMRTGKPPNTEGSR